MLAGDNMFDMNDTSGKLLGRAVRRQQRTAILPARQSRFNTLWDGPHA